MRKIIKMELLHPDAGITSQPLVQPQPQAHLEVGPQPHSSSEGEEIPTWTGDSSKDLVSAEYWINQIQVKYIDRVPYFH